ncbi:MAG: hypothetical protein MUE99_10045 [Chitinophagaceae bacterium]|jgi:hypothetical protein|nr:hypothetical protein [Chitinophagaceae bacterium]
MKKYLKITILALIAFDMHNLWAQDKVVLLNGDSIPCKIPGNPRKETDLSNQAIGRINDYGFKSVVAIYPGDSIRIHRAGEIKGYVKQEKGTYLGAGFFVSRIINEKDINYKIGNTRSVFLQRVNLHKDYTFWYYREDLGDPMPAPYFLIETKGREGFDLITSYKSWKRWAIAHPPFGEITFEKGKPKKKGKYWVGPFFAYLVDVVDEYKKRSP